MPEEQTRFDHEINIDEPGVASTTRFDRMFEADVSGVRMALDDGRTSLCFKWASSGHIEASLERGTGRVLWGRFSGLGPAVFQLSDAFGTVEGELKAGPVIENPSGFEVYLREGGTAVVMRVNGVYRVSLYRKSPAKKQRRGGRELMIVTSAVRRSQSDDLFQAIDEALNSEDTLEEAIQF